MSAEQQPGDEGYKGWFYLGYYAAMFCSKVGELGQRACQAIARGSSEPDGAQQSVAHLRTNMAPLQLTQRDTAHLQFLYEYVEFPHQLNEVILEVQRHDPGKA